MSHALPIDAAIPQPSPGPVAPRGGGPAPPRVRAETVEPQPSPAELKSALALAIVGPGVAGAVVGLPESVDVLLLLMWRLPVAIFGAALALLPALYIGCAFAGRAPPPRAFAHHALLSLGDFGTVVLGGSPALAFLLSVSTDRMDAALLVLGAWLAACLMWSASMARRLRVFSVDARRGRVVALYLAWSAVSAGVALRLFVAAVFTGVSP